MTELVDDPRVVFENWPCDSRPTSNALVAIFIPVYNDQEYIGQAIESILKQTHANWLLDVIDNNSDDRTPYVVEEYSRKESRISHRRFDELIGANANHSRGFAAIDPESAYCKVVQADDFIFPDCLQRMVEVAERHPEVGFVTSYRRIEDVVDLIALPLSREVARGTDVIRRCVLGSPHILGAPTASLLRTDLVLARQPFYDSTFSHADTDAAYDVLARADFGHVHQVLTYSRSRDSRFTFAQDAYCWGPESVRILMRHGPGVLSRDEFRRRLRFELEHYSRFLVTQRLRPQRRHDMRFHTYHSLQLDYIEAEAGAHPAVQRVARILRALVQDAGAEAEDLVEFF